MANKFKDAIKPGVITIGGNTDLRVEALLEANATVKNQAKKSIEAYTEAVDYYYQEQIYQAPLALKEALASYLAAIKQNEYALHSPENQLENINTHAQYIVEQIEHPHEKPATQEAIQY